MENVDETALSALLDAPERFALVQETYAKLRGELAAGRRLVYLTDNCGEIVMDKLLIRTLQACYPQLRITVIVRGAPVLNDATMKDAQQIGLTALCSVIDNGNGIAGTHFPALGEAARAAIEAADIILSKGQANYETGLKQYEAGLLGRGIPAKNIRKYGFAFRGKECLIRKG